MMSGLNVSGRYLSSLIRELQDMGLIRILEVGERGVATTYLIHTKEYILNNLHNLIIDPNVLTIPNNLCLMIWVQDAHKVGYQKDLTPTQKMVLELVHYKNFSVSELASILVMRERDLSRRVLKGLDKYLKIDKKGFVNLKMDIEQVLDKNFDKERLEAVISNIKKERDKYKTKFLFEPLRKMLMEMEDKELSSRAKAKS